MPFRNVAGRISKLQKVWNGPSGRLSTSFFSFEKIGLEHISISFFPDSFWKDSLKDGMV